MKTTKKHFELFKRSCEYWIERFKLDNWKVNYVHGTIRPDTYANCETKVSGYIATIHFCKKWYTSEGNYMPTKENIEETAKHEVIHLLLARLSDYGTSRMYTADDCYEAEEELVRKLHNIIK